MQGVNALGHGQQAQKLDGFGLAFLEPGNRCCCRVARGQHGVHHDDVALLHVLGHLEVVLHRLQRGRVAVQADVAHARAGHHLQHAVQNAVARAQYGHKHQLFAVNLLGLHFFQRGLDFHILRGHVARHLIGHQAAEFAQQAAKAVGAGVFFAHQRELVLHQRVVDQVHMGAGGVGYLDHFFCSLVEHPGTAVRSANSNPNAGEPRALPRAQLQGPIPKDSSMLCSGPSGLVRCTVV